MNENVPWPWAPAVAVPAALGAIWEDGSGLTTVASPLGFAKDVALTVTLLTLTLTRGTGEGEQPAFIMGATTSTHTWRAVLYTPAPGSHNQKGPLAAMADDMSTHSLMVVLPSELVMVTRVYGDGGQ